MARPRDAEMTFMARPRDAEMTFGSTDESHVEGAEKYILLGSCFAQYMGEKMQAEGWVVTSNPLGTLYNPFSILQTVRAALHLDEACIPVFPTDGEWRCWWANTTFRTPTEEGTRALVKAQLQSLRDALLEARKMVVTLGTNVCYKLQENGMVVTNCQRQPDRLFHEYRAPLSEVTTVLEELVKEVLSANPEMEITFTVSPYRYKKYGLHGSQLSKATLLLAVDEVVKAHPGVCHYFPAYEVMMDELRDYRYYAPDGVHPSAEAVEIIWERWKSF